MMQTLDTRTPMTPELRAIRNTEGAERGCATCPGCGDSAWGKAFHETPYYTGRMTSDPDDAGNVIVFHGTSSLAVICEDCHGKMTPAERLPHCVAKVESWKSAIPSVKRKATLSGLVDDPDDVARFAREIAAVDAVLVSVTDAVMAGK